jgi:hypothetical protein
MTEENSNEMTEQNSNADLVSEFSKALREYTDYLAAHGATICERYFLISLSASDVQRAFIEHIKRNEIFLAAECFSVPENYEEIKILFVFQCLPPTLCFIPPAFLVKLNIVTSKVVEIVDPYVGPLSLSMYKPTAVRTGMPTSANFPFPGITWTPFPGIGPFSNIWERVYGYW